MRARFVIAGAVMALAGFASLSANAATSIVIPGTANPFLAGAADGGYITYNGAGIDANTDYAPASSPVSLAVVAGSMINISNVINNGVGNCPGCAGASGSHSSSPFMANGFTELFASYSNLELNSLVGGFNGPNGGTLFEIGSGGNFLVPIGATQFYLGTVDGYQWNNNEGNFSALISSGVPEPATWALFIMGFGGIGAAMRFSRRKNAVPALS